MNHDATAGLKKLLTGMIITLVLLFCAFYIQAYTTAVDIHDAQVSGCERSKLDRRATLDRDKDLSEFFNAAARARLADGNEDVARQYTEFARRAQDRRKATVVRVVDCQDAYPKPSLVPFQD